MASNGDVKEASSDSWRKEFLSDLRDIRKKGKELKLTEEQIDDLFFQSEWIDKPSPIRVGIRGTFKVWQENGTDGGCIYC